MAPPLRDAWPWQRHLAFLGLRVLLGEVAPAPPPPPSAPPREQETGCFPEGLSPPRCFVPSPRALRGRQGLRGTPAPGFSASSSAGRRPSRTLLCRLPAPATPDKAPGSCRAVGLPRPVQVPPPLQDSEAIPAGLTWATPQGAGLFLTPPPAEGLPGAHAAAPGATPSRGPGEARPETGGVLFTSQPAGLVLPSGRLFPLGRTGLQWPGNHPAITLCHLKFIH